jgi:hypothetical protein
MSKCDASFTIPPAHLAQITLKKLLTGPHAPLLTQPYIMSVIDNIFNEMSVRMGPNAILGYQYRLNNGLPAPMYNCRNVQWPSWDGQMHYSEECIIYLLGV